MALAAVALGANLGDPRSTLEAATVELGALGRVLAVSRLIETEPVGYTGQPNFLNGAVLLHTDLPPLALLQALLVIERRHGRDRSHGIAKGPRTLDLDLLLYEAIVLHTEELTLPHPEMHRRLFVLEPLAEIAPAMVHPLLVKTITELLTDLTRSQ